MPKRKARHGEHTCHCRAYRFPHRFGGGKCTGIHIAGETWEQCWGGGICSTCNCLRDDHGPKQCDVVNGAESIVECEAYQEFINYHEIKIY